jgi:hypothetical protein
MTLIITYILSGVIGLMGPSESIIGGVAMAGSGGLTGPFAGSMVSVG